MAKITSTLSRLKAFATEYPHLANLTFREGHDFAWNPNISEITYNPDAADAALYLLHEFGHAVLSHDTYTLDINLLQMERDAWQTALAYASRLNLTISPAIIDASLDTYRDWLHSRSLCPKCEATGVQTVTSEYLCPACGTRWRANDARGCALRRYTIRKHLA